MPKSIRHWPQPSNDVRLLARQKERGGGPVISDELAARINKHEAELHEAVLLLRIAVKKASRQINCAFGALVASGATLGYADEHDAEGGKGDSRC